MFYTYAHKKPDGAIFYIGKGMDRRAWENSGRKNPHWSRTVEKYGREVIILAEWETEAEAFEHEKFLIACFKGMAHPLVNLTNGGEGSGGYKWSEDQRKKRPTTVGIFNPMFGRKHSEETRKKIADKAKLRKASDETRKKLSNAMKQRVTKDSTRQKLSILNAGSNNASAKPCSVFGVVYACGTDAAKALNVSKYVISRRLRSERYPEYFYL